MGARRARAVVLDAGALIAFERNDRKVLRLVELSIELASPLHVSTAVVAQIWRDGARQTRLARLLRGEALEAPARSRRRAGGRRDLRGERAETAVLAR